MYTLNNEELIMVGGGSDGGSREEYNNSNGLTSRNESHPSSWSGMTTSNNLNTVGSTLSCAIGVVGAVASWGAGPVVGGLATAAAVANCVSTAGQAVANANSQK